MFLWAFIICSIFLLCLTLLIDRDIFNPNYAFLVPWTIAAIFVRFTSFDYNGNSEAYLYLALGAIAFSIGNIFGHGDIEKVKRDRHQSVLNLKPNYTLLLLIQLSQIMMLIYCWISFRGRLGSGLGQNVVQSFLLSTEAVGSSNRSGYLLNINSAICIVLFLYYGWIPQLEKKRYNIVLAFELAIYLLLLVMRFTRNSVLLYTVPLVFVYFIVSPKDAFSRLKILLAATIAFLLFFVTYSRLKYSYLYTESNVVSESLRQLSGYLSGAIVAFQRVFDSGTFPKSYGANTFRFFYAVFDRIRGTSNAREVVQLYTELGGSGFSIINVYTFYYWYVCDFGLLYAIFVQFIIGVMHGFLYKQLYKGSLVGSYIYCLMVGPLVMQFFQDEYFSLMSNWLQMILIGLLFIWIQHLVWLVPSSSHSRRYWKESITGRA